MRKTTALRLVVLLLVGIAGLFISLTLAGRKIGDHPLPWHTAWMAPLGKKSWDEGFHLSIQNGWSKTKVRKSIGDPVWVIIDGTMRPIEDIDLGESRPFERWAYASPHSKSGSGWIITFKNNILVDH